MASTKPRVKVPKTANKGDVIEVKTLISHKMETGLRKDKATGEEIPRMIINKFVAKFNGKPVFEVDMEPSIAANPYFKFTFKAEESGEFEFTWTDDQGTVYSAKKPLTVS